MQARRRAQPSGTNSPSSSHPRSKHRARCAIFRPCPPCGRQGRPGQGFLAGSNIRAAGERPPRARPQRRGSPGPIPNPAVKPAFAESTAARGCGRAGRRARGGRFSICARGGSPPRPLASCAPREARGGICPLRAFSRVGRHCPAGCRDRCRGPPIWPAFDASGACVPREWMDFFVSANGVAIAPVYPGLVLLLGLFGI